MAVPILVAIAFALLAASIVATVAGELARRMDNPRYPSLVWVMIMLAPLVVALTVVLGLLTPDLGGHCHCDEHGLHHPHICPAHPLLAAPMLLPAAYLLVIWALWAAPRLRSLMRDCWETWCWWRRARRLPQAQVAGMSVHVGPCGSMGAVSIGSCVVVDPKVIEQFSQEELLALVSHEQGHGRRQDTVALFVLRLVDALVPSPASSVVIKAWRRSAELACDRLAACRTGDPCLVAAALLAVEKMTPREHAPLGLMAARGAEDLELRVTSLLTDVPTRGPLTGDLRVAIALVMVTLAALAMPGDHVHHAVETVLGLFIHMHPGA